MTGRIEQLYAANTHFKNVTYNYDPVDDKVELTSADDTFLSALMVLSITHQAQLKQIIMKDLEQC